MAASGGAGPPPRGAFPRALRPPRPPRGHDARPRRAAQASPPRTRPSPGRPAPGSRRRETGARVPRALLRPGRRRGPRRARARGPLRRRHGAPRVRAPVRDGHAEAARLQPEDRGARLVEPAHGRGDGERRHALPRRLGDDGVEPPGPHAAPPRPSPREDGARQGGRPRLVRARGTRRRARIPHPRGGRPGKRPGPAQGPGRRAPRGARRRARGRRGLEADARGDAGHRRRARAPAQGARRGRRGGDAGLPRVGARRELHLHRLPRVRARRRRRRGAAADRAALGPGRPARAEAGRDLAELPRAPGGHPGAGAGAAAPRPHQGQLARDGPPSRLPGLRRREALRRRGPRGRRAPLRRPLHLVRLPRRPARHPAPSAQGGARAGGGRLPAGEPRAQEPRVHAARVSPGRALPGRRALAPRDRHGRAAAGRPAAHAPLPAARPLRPLLFLPHLPAARELQHRRARAHPGDPAPAPRRGQRRVHGAALRRGARAHPHAGAHLARGTSRSSTRAPSRPRSSRPRAAGRTTCGSPSSTRTARSAPFRSCAATAPPSPWPTATRFRPARPCATSRSSRRSTRATPSP